jgi:cellulose synthase/poly-beta-1,6-N-acetylglucosamine synthase-like glycosyltransferase
MFILELIFLVIGVYLLFYSIFSLFLILISLFERRLPSQALNKQNPEILVILPAYRPSSIFAHVLESTKAAASGRNIKVYVLLQEADPAYHKLAEDKGFVVEEKRFSHLKGNSYQHALRHISDQVIAGKQSGRWSPHFIMIVDKDNILREDFFDQIPPDIYSSYDVIQGRRTALNADTPFAFFDTMSEKLNDSMLRTAKQQCGSMVEISGSGVLIETSLFVDTVQSLDHNAPGFDKNFMVKILTSSRTVRSIFWPVSELHEEKTSDPADMHRQRLRWFGEQYYNAIFNFKSLLTASIAKRQLAPLDYLITLWRPPRSVQLVLTPFIGLLETAWITAYGYWPLDFPVYTVASVVLALAIGLFVIKQGAVMQTLLYSTKLPVLAVGNFFAAARSMKKENRGTFIHTKHKL